MKFCFISLLLLPFAVMAADTNALPTLVPAYDPISPTFWEHYGTTILICGAIIIALAGLILWIRLRPKPPVNTPPEVLARAALTQLSTRVEDGKLLSLVSQILRHYISAAFELAPGELTTTEFYAAIARCEKIDLELGEGISSFLRECDQRKFSLTDSPTPLNAVERALELISLAEKRRPQVLPTQ